MSSLQGFLGRKLGMMRVYNPMGQVVPVTVLEMGPCTVVQKKTIQREGYNALQLGFGPKKMGRMTRSEQGHCKKAGLDQGFYRLQEFPVDDPDMYETGQVLTLNDIKIESLVDVIGTSKGHGFTGTVKRYGFNRGKMTHGSKCHREMGSVGQSAFPSRVLKGKRMPGRMGGVRTTLKNAMVVEVRPAENVLLVKGGVPGAPNQIVSIRCK